MAACMSGNDVGTGTAPSTSSALKGSPRDVGDRAGGDEQVVTVGVFDDEVIARGGFQAAEQPVGVEGRAEFDRVGRVLLLFEVVLV